MKPNIQSYFDAAKKARNPEPLLSKDEILHKLAHTSPSSIPTSSHWKVKALVGGSVLMAAAAIFLYTTSKNQTTAVPQPTATYSKSERQSVSSHPSETPATSPSNDHSVSNIISMEEVAEGTSISCFNNTFPSEFNNQPTTKLTNSELSTESLPPPLLPVSNTKDIKGVERLELTESEAIVLATHYPKLHVWLQRKFAGSDTCDISLAPTDKDKTDYRIYHSALLLKINFEHSEAREFLLWFTPNKEFTSALPGRYREQLVSELHALAEVETRCIPAEQACKAVKGDSPFFDLCRRESGALLGVSISPNPARDNAECTFTLKDQRDINISLHDLNGRFVRTMIFNELKPSGENKVPLMLEGVPAGAYLLAIRTERGEQAVQQLVVGQ
jgi:hypothetical protein